MHRHSRSMLVLALGAACLCGGACVERSVEVKLDGGLQVREVREGHGLAARQGSAVEVSYRGTLPDGKVVVDTYRDGKTHKFTVGDGTVITGLDRAVRGMKPGGKRVVLLPSASHYGQKGYAGIVPAESMLEMEIEMVQVRTSWY